MWFHKTTSNWQSQNKSVTKDGQKLTAPKNEAMCQPNIPGFHTTLSFVQHLKNAVSKNILILKINNMHNATITASTVETMSCEWTAPLQHVYSSVASMHSQPNGRSIGWWFIMWQLHLIWVRSTTAACWFNYSQHTLSHKWQQCWLLIHSLCDNSGCGQHHCSMLM